ncbi:MAG: nitroreductase family protein [Sarcina sp.]
MKNQVIENMKNRRSTRNFNDKEISEEILKKMVEAGSYAPNGHNMQPWHFTIIQNQNILDELNIEAKENFKISDNDFIKKLGNNPKFNCFYGANTVAIISADPKSVTGNTDCILASQNFMLAGTSLGVSSCWVETGRMAFEGTNADKYRKLVEIPEGFEIVSMIVLGYSDANLKVPERKVDIFTIIK